MIKYVVLSVGLLLSGNVSAQGALEEIVVTAMKADVSLPGTVLRKKGDFLLLEVLLSNDTRDEKEREGEIMRTLKNAQSTARKNSAIELSLIEDGIVVPLKLSRSRIKLHNGNRPDTSQTRIRVKTSIPDNSAQASQLVDQLKSFVEDVPVVGRTQLTALSRVDVSIVAPDQYRKEIIALILADIKEVTAGLGEEYKVVVQGLDRPVRWVRDGSLHLSMFVPFSYIVIPENVNAINVNSDY